MTVLGASHGWVRFGTLEAICAALDRQPGDLLEFVADEAPALSRS